MKTKRKTTVQTSAPVKCLVIKPIPELDRAVAEIVMGWTWAVDECECPSLNHGRCRKQDGMIVCDFKPSVDLRSTWLVVDELRERRHTTGGWWMSLRQVAGVDGEWVAVFSFGGMHFNHPRCEATGWTAQQAICLAAIKAAKQSMAF